MSIDSDSHPIYALPLGSLFRSRPAKSQRASSFDRTGRNEDWITVWPGETAVLLACEGSGCVTHLYCAWMFPDVREYRNAILRCYWDGAISPSVEVPLGDYFGIAHGHVREFAGPFLAVNGGCGVSHGLNAYFPMPFSSSALVTLENRGETSLGGPWEALWYHIDYETYAEPLPDEVQTFHASYRQRPSAQSDGDGICHVVVETEGRGRMAGLTLGDCARSEEGADWGDAEMVCVDGGVAASLDPEGGGVAHAHQASRRRAAERRESNVAASASGPVAIHRWCHPHPIHFSRSLRWTIELRPRRGIAGAYASVAYWYQSPAARLPPLPNADALLPRLDVGYDTAREVLFDFILQDSEDAVDAATRAERFRAACQAGASLYSGEFDRTLDVIATWRASR